MAAGYDQINGAMAARCGFRLSLEPLAKDIDIGKIKEFLAHCPTLAVGAVHATQSIAYFGIFSAYINHVIHGFFWHIRSKNRFIPVFYESPVFCHKE